MTYKEALTMVKELDKNIMYKLCGKNYIEVTVNDFSDLYDDWDDYDPIAVQNFLNELEKECINIEDESSYSEYYFDDFIVKVRFL